MTREQLKDLGYEETSPGYWSRRSGSSAIPHPQPQHDARPALERVGQGREGGNQSVGSGPKWRVTIISMRSKALDSDNLAGGAKHLRDAIARWLNPDAADPDADTYIEWHYGQLISKTKTTLVTIETL